MKLTRIAALAACLLLLVILHFGFRVWTGNGNRSSELSQLGKIVRTFTVWQGFESIRLYELESNNEMIRRFVEARKFELVTTKKPVESFLSAKDQLPDWWENKSSQLRYFRSDSEKENYWLIWVSEDQLRVHLEIGQW